MRTFKFSPKSWPSLALWFTSMLLVTVLLLTSANHRLGVLQQLSAILSHHRMICTIFRWVLLSVLFLTWPRIVQFCARKADWEYERTLFWKGRRVKVTVWLILFEVIINEHIVRTLWQWWGSR